MTEPGPSELVSNKAVEDAAIAFVIAYERQQGRAARDTRHRGAPADLESGERVIEVKAAGRSARGQDLWLEVRQVEVARTNPNFHVYVVDNVRQGDPDLFRLIDLGGNTLTRLLERAKEQRYYTVPFPVAVYDELIEQFSSGNAPGHMGTSLSGELLLSGPDERGSETWREIPDDPVAMSRTQAILWVLEHNPGPMRPVDVWTQLHRLGRKDDPKGDVSTATYDLWRAGRVGKVGRGLYTSLRDDPSHDGSDVAGPSQ